MPQQIDLGQFIWPDAEQRRQPQIAFGIDRANPLAAGLLLAMTPTAGFINLASSVAVVAIGGGLTIGQANASGIPFVSSSNTDYFSFTPPTTLTAGTILAVTSGNASGSAGSIWQTNNSESDFAPFSDGNFYFNTWASSRYISAAALPAGSNYNKLVILARGGSTSNSHQVFIDGKQIGSTNSVFTANSSIRLGANGFSGGSAAALYLLWNRALTDAEVASISADPWQLFAPPTLGFYGPAANADNLLGQACL